MKTEEKQAVVTKLTDKLRSSTSFYLADFTGLNVKAITVLRARLRSAGLECLVVKNTLAERALQGLDLPDIAEFFRGPTALVIGRSDPIVAAKVLADFAKEHQDRPSVKAAIVERRAVSAEEVGRLAKLPPREQLLAELAGALESPMAQLMYVMQAKLTEMAGLLEALSAARSE
jgi:large subunit ribosomal protein L10